MTLEKCILNKNKSLFFFFFFSQGLGGPGTLRHHSGGRQQRHHQWHAGLHLSAEQPGGEELPWSRWATHRRLHHHWLPQLHHWGSAQRQFHDQQQPGDAARLPAAGERYKCPGFILFGLIEYKISENKNIFDGDIIIIWWLVKIFCDVCGFLITPNQLTRQFFSPWAESPGTEADNGHGFFFFLWTVISWFLYYQMN